jgi:hypothetical protein
MSDGGKTLAAGRTFGDGPTKCPFKRGALTFDFAAMKLVFDVKAHRDLPYRRR